MYFVYIEILDNIESFFFDILLFIYKINFIYGFYYMKKVGLTPTSHKKLIMNHFLIFFNFQTRNETHKLYNNVHIRTY